MKMNKGVLTATCLCLIGAAGVFLLLRHLAHAPSAATTNKTVETAATLATSLASDTPAFPPATAPTGMRTYGSKRFRFELFYPQDLTVQTYDEGGGAQTLAFQNVQTAQGFQIYVAPYSDSQITEERFRQDEPSGVRNGLKNIAIDGATGASFYSTNTALGDTAEVWIIHGGYLFEVTTPKSEAAWLSNIMQTWKWF